MRKLIVLVSLLIVFLGVWSVIARFVPQASEIFKTQKGSPFSQEKVKVVSEESVVVEVVEKVTLSVVTVGVQQRIVEIDPFDPFGTFKRPRGDSTQEQDIGSGFIVSQDGLIVTNRHVVESPGKYTVITHDGKKYAVESIYRDPANDIAILKVKASGLKPATLGDSSKIKVGQLVVAIGTPLGEFRGSVTKGIVSGIGRGITTGSPFEGYVERLDNVIQTDAAVNLGNSGGPLVNSSSQVIGVNTAVASGAENISFAIPINLIKDAIGNFEKTGGFSRPYLGVAYRMISRDLAILNELPEGAYVQEVVDGTAAFKAGIEVGDIIVKFDGSRVQDKEGGLAGLIGKKKINDKIAISLWRDGKTIDVTAALESAPNQ